MTTPDKEEMPTEDRTVFVEVVGGRAGECLCINDRRVAGPKPWGGGAVVRRFEVPISELLTACNAYEPMREALKEAEVALRWAIKSTAAELQPGYVSIFSHPLETVLAALSTLPVNDRHHSGSDSYQADAGAPALSEKVNVRSEWRPIESAPADGTEILAYMPGLALGQIVLYWQDGYWRKKANSMGLKYPPTHWMPLPSPPGAELNFSNEPESDAGSLTSDTSSQPASEAGKLSTDEVQS